MSWKSAAWIVTGLAFVAGNSAGAQVASKSADHSPHPVQDSGPADIFHGYRCGADCSLHQKGYQWAADHRIVNPSDCKGTSEEFIEGCRAFAGIDGPLGEKPVFQDED